MIDPELLKQGYKKFQFPLSEEFLEYLKQGDWDKLDSIVSKLCLPGAELFQFLSQFHPFSSIEHIIALRHDHNDEDGIWHDDGSRFLVFTLSLNESPEEIQGGELLLKKKGHSQVTTFTPPKIGTLLVFPTGRYDYEHKVCKVTKGTRKTIAGWCS